MNKTNLILDLGILTAFLVAMEPSLTGKSLHEWLAVSFSAVIITHILLHWKWITNVGINFLKKLFHSSRLKFVVDSLLFVSFTAIMVSGLMISRSVLPALGLSVAENPAWSMLHRLSANSTLALVGLHFALNWNWVVAMVKRYLAHPLAGLFQKHPAAALSPVEVAVKPEILRVKRS
jgi:hypothetical protein